MQVEIGKTYRLVADDPGINSYTHGTLVTISSGNGCYFRSVHDKWFILLDGTLPGYGHVIEATQAEIDAFRCQASPDAPAETAVLPPAPPRALWDDEPGDLERFRERFKTWDFSSFAG